MSRDHVSKPHPFFTMAPTNSAVTISVQGVATGSGCNMNYITLSSNLPNTYGNNFYVWPSTDGNIPWGNAPIATVPVPTDNATSTMPVNYPAQQKGYVIGYGVAPTPKSTCAQVYVPSPNATPDQYQSNNTTLQVVYVGLNLVQVKYATLPGYDPGGNGNWIGMWQAMQVPWAGDPIQGGYLAVPAGSPSFGYLNLTGAVLQSGYPYVVGYFTVAKATGRTSLAAATSFIVGQ